MKSKNQQRRLKKKLEKQTASEPAHTWHQPQLVVKPPQESSLATHFNEIKEDDPLYEMYQQVSQRFKRPFNNQENDSEKLDSNTKPSQVEQHEDAPNSEPETSTEKPSRKQQRQQQKPLLSDLKKYSNRPELIEWFDTDAAHPEFLVKLKTLPNAVQVPANWQSRSEIPQFNGKPKYELPANIRETGIEEQRVLSRESKRLDVDYEKLHDAIFSANGRKLAEPVDMLEYGRVADLRYRTRSYRPKQQPEVLSKPTEVSPKLMKALNINPGDPLPWEQAVEKFGVAPGYAQSEPIKLWGSF